MHTRSKTCIWRTVRFDLGFATALHPASSWSLIRLVWPDPISLLCLSWGPVLPCPGRCTETSAESSVGRPPTSRPSLSDTRRLFYFYSCQKASLDPSILYIPKVVRVVSKSNLPRPSMVWLPAFGLTRVTVAGYATLSISRLTIYSAYPCQI